MPQGQRDGDGVQNGLQREVGLCDPVLQGRQLGRLGVEAGSEAGAAAEAVPEVGRAPDGPDDEAELVEGDLAFRESELALLPQVVIDQREVERPGSLEGSADGL